MNRRNFLAASAAAALASCARMDKRAARYDEKQCPFCTTKAGVCSYCGGNGKCSFCGGKGKRKTVSPDIPEENIKPGSYEEQCPYCKGSGTCRYCHSSGKCWACKGSGKIENWDFYEQSKQTKG
jgi:RecJ-like exonuclease